MTCKDGKESFVMYASFLKAAECLTGDDFKEFILKLRDYALYGEESESDNLIVNTMLIMAKPNIKAAAERYQRCVDNGNKGKEFGKDGGRPKKGETLEEYHERKSLEKTPRKPLNDDDNIDDDENLKVYDTNDEKHNRNINKELNRKDNWNINAPTGKTSTFSSLSSFSSNSSSVSNLQNEIPGASKSGYDDEKNSNLSVSSMSSSNPPEATYANARNEIQASKEEYVQELQGYLIKMAKQALGINPPHDFSETFANAVQCYMDHEGVTKAKAAKEIEQGIKNFKEGIQSRMEAERLRQDEKPSEVEENEDPF